MKKDEHKLSENDNLKPFKDKSLHNIALDDKNSLKRQIEDKEPNIDWYIGKQVREFSEMKIDGERLIDKLSGYHTFLGIVMDEPKKVKVYIKGGYNDKR